MDEATYEDTIARQKACAAVIEDIDEILAEEDLESDDDSVSVTGIALKMYLVAYSMKKEYWGAAFKMADMFCIYANIEDKGLYDMAMNMYTMERETLDMLSKNP